MGRVIPPTLMWMLAIVGLVAVVYVVWIFRNFGTGRKRTGRSIFEREQDFHSEIEADAAEAQRWADEVKQADALIDRARGSGAEEVACPKCGLMIKPPNACAGCGWKHPLW